MKCYIIQRVRDGILLTCESLDKKGQVVRYVASGFEIGCLSKKSLALANAIMLHYYDAVESNLPGKMEANRQAQPFLDAFLLHHSLPLNGKLEIPGEVIDRFFALASQNVLA